MTIATWITLSRIPLLFIITILLFIDFKWSATAALILYIIAGVSDWLDGYIARKQNIVSELGKLLDALNDKIFTVGMFSALIATRLVPAWTIFCALIILSREFLITGLRILVAKQGKILPAEKFGKIKTTLQMVSLGLFILVKSFSQDLTFFCKFISMPFVYYSALVLLVIATTLTAISGIKYVWQYRSLLKR